MATVTRPTREIPLSEYPTGDGKPMAETFIHGEIMFGVRQILQDHFAEDPMVYVAGNLMMYYVRNNLRRHTSPDVFFVRGIPNVERKCYFVWEEGKGPDVVFEISSKTTSKVDTGTKLLLYQNVLRVPEYFLFDPYEEYLSPSMQGYRLVNGIYVPIQPDHGWLFSQELGLRMGRHGRMLRFYNPATGQPLLSRKELLEDERHLRVRAQAEVQLAQMEARHAEAEKQRIEAEKQRVEAEKERVEAEKRQLTESLRQAEEARVASEREQEKLRRELEGLRRRPKKRS
ncbi:MAG: Uma2 family endonuclease [Isosphaeraceae bacterium]